MKVKTLFTKFRYFISEDFIALVIFSQGIRIVYTFETNDIITREAPNILEKWINHNGYREVKKSEIPEDILKRILAHYESEKTI